MGERPTQLIDLSHVITEGMVTYKGLPGPHICDFISREQSVANYDDGSTFQIGRIDMVSNTGTYVDVPSHRFVDGKDLSEVEIEAFANLPALVIRQPFEEGLAVDVAAFDGLDVRGKAVLIATGWDRHWGTDQYYHDHSFLTEAAAQRLAADGVALVGIDSHNIDDTRVRMRPVHTTLLGAGIPICEHMTGLGALPHGGFRFSAAPPKVKGMGTFPVRAYALIDA
jgi:arylformamidase